MNEPDPFRPRHSIAYLMITGTTLLWAASTVIGRGVHEELPPFGLSYWRWLAASLVILPFALTKFNQKIPIIREHLGLLALLGFLQAGSSALFFLGLNFTTAINAALINAAQPVLTVIPAWFLTSERITLRQGGGIVLGLAGVFLIITKADIATVSRLDFNIGDIIVLIGVTGWSVYAALIHRTPLKLGFPTTIFSIYALGSLSLLPLYLIEAAYYRPMPFNQLSITTVIVIGVIISAAGVTMWSASVRSVGPNRASVFLNLIPVFTTLMAITFLGEQLLIYHIFGILLIGAAMYLMISQSKQSR